MRLLEETRWQMCFQKRNGRKSWPRFGAAVTKTQNLSSPQCCAETESLAGEEMKNCLGSRILCFAPRVSQSLWTAVSGMDADGTAACQSPEGISGNQRFLETKPVTVRSEGFSERKGGEFFVFGSTHSQSQRKCWQNLKPSLHLGQNTIKPLKDESNRTIRWRWWACARVAWRGL
jgi:hypothetical protein